MGHIVEGHYLFPETFLERLKDGWRGLPPPGPPPWSRIGPEWVATAGVSGYNIEIRRRVLTWGRGRREWRASGAEGTTP